MDTKTLPRQAHKRRAAEMMAFDDARTWITEGLGCLVIGLGMLKGGTGKTTSAIYLALYMAVSMGLKVVVIDTDDNSQSVENWYALREQRGEDVPFDLVLYKNRKEDDPDLDEVIEGLRDSHDVVIVDIGGGDKQAYWDLCTTAHILIMPTAPSGYETTRIAPSMRMAIKAAKANTTETGLNAYVLLIKTSKGNRLADEQRIFLEAALEPLDQVEALVPEEFSISGAVHYPRSWEDTPKRTELDEFGMLLRYTLKGAA